MIVWCLLFPIQALALPKDSQKQELFYQIQQDFHKIMGTSGNDSAVQCEQDWQQKVCDGSIMCYATKCFYPHIKIAPLHAIFLENLIESLKERAMDNEEAIAHIAQIAQFGMPQDNKQHDFIFINSNNVSCRYTLWLKDSKTLFFDLSGCAKANNERITRTLIQHESGVLESYEHIAY